MKSPQGLMKRIRDGSKKSGDHVTFFTRVSRSSILAELTKHNALASDVATRSFSMAVVSVKNKKLRISLLLKSRRSLSFSPPLR